MTIRHITGSSGALIAVAVAVTGCSLVFGNADTQCASDSDCERFGQHPSCQQGVCVASGLGPPGCFFGQPAAPDEFASQCTTAQAIPFDNCARLGLCDDSALAGAFSISATPGDLGMIPPAVDNEAMPMIGCAELGQVIYITGSTNLPPLIKAVQPLLSAGSPAYTAVFAPQTSCKGAAAVYDPNPAKHVITNVANNWPFYYDANGDQKFCLLDSGGNTVDVGESDVFPTSCDPSYVDRPGIADYAGPIQAIAFVVTSSSSQVSISAEAAHIVFGSGGDNGRAAPWTDPTLYFIRSSGTGTVQLPARAIGLPAPAWWGLDRLSAKNVVSAMEAIDPHVAEAGIGVLSNDFADRNRANLRALAFQQQGQRYGYLPDSSAESYDKANVRDGHYPIWGAIHLLAATQNNEPSQAASALVTQFAVAKLDESLVAAIIKSGFVPRCAMTVQRSIEVGPVTAYQPQFGCGCYFDKQTSGTTSCQACGGPGDCPSTAPSCNYGYCEVR